MPHDPQRLGEAAVNIVLDLAPILPGGSNGGAKWVALNLARSLMQLLPFWRFYGLVNSFTEEEIVAALPGIRPICLLDSRGYCGDVSFPILPDGQTAHIQLCLFTGPNLHHPSVPTVTIVYDLQFHHYPMFFPAEDAEQRERNFLATLKVSDALVCISEYVRQTVYHFLSEFGRPPFPRDRVEMVHIQMADRLPRQFDEGVLARLGISTGRYLIFPANTWPHKNHTMLLTAFGLYHARNPDSDLKLLCCGVSEQHDGAFIRMAACRMGLADKVLFPGFLDEDELACLFTHALGLIFPSLFEGFGMPLLEAMATGCPVLCSSATSMPEVAGDAALFFDPRRPQEIAAVIERLEGSPELQAELRDRGSKRLAQFAEGPSMAAGYRDILIGVLARRGIDPAALPAACPFWGLDVPLNFHADSSNTPLLTQGWAAREEAGVWMVDDRSEMYIRTYAPPGDMRLCLNGTAFVGPGQVAQPLAVYVNGVPVGHFEVGGERDMVMMVPASVWEREAPVRFTFVHPGGRSPRRLNLSDDARRLSVFVKYLALLPQ